MKLSSSCLGGVGGAGAARAVSEKNAIFKSFPRISINNVTITTNKVCHHLCNTTKFLLVWFNGRMAPSA